MPLTLGYSIDELIVRDVETTLRKVRKISGCHFDLIVEREEQLGNSPRHGLVVIVAGDPLPETAPLSFDQFKLPIGLVGYVMLSEESTLDVETELRWMAADIRRALGTDVHRGNNAINTTFEARDEFFTKESPKHVLVTAFAQYRHLRNNPYSRGG